MNTPGEVDFKRIVNDEELLHYYLKKELKYSLYYVKLKY